MFAIGFSDLWTYGAGTQERLPLSALPAEGGHIHGRLQMQVAGRHVPDLGFFGPTDVCLNEWAHELHSALLVLQASPESSHTYDEGEQGQPAYRFERLGEHLYVSVVDAAFSGGKADPEWQKVECGFGDFAEAVAAFLVAFRSQVEREAPATGTLWWRQAVERAAALEQRD